MIFRYNAAMEAQRQNTTYSAWHPGIEPEIPPAYRELETIYNPAHVFTSLDEIEQLVGNTGLGALELISFRPERLILHELIARVTADIVVVEGEAEEDLGINFRAITTRILEHYVQPHLSRIQAHYDSVQLRIEELVQQELEAVAQRLQPVTAPPPSLWQRLIGHKPTPPASLSREERELGLINEYKQRRHETRDEFEAAVFRSLHRVLASIVRTRGFLGNDRGFLAQVCLLHASNYLCSQQVGRIVGDLLREAIEKEGYDLIPDAEKPVLISLKGASASGKSSLRPTLREMMAQLGIEDHGYGTISPDIWRKLLLDYESLGKSFKYAGRFTSHEVGVIDTKLDRYIRAKAKKSHSIPHLVVDRFRFDSFSSEKIARILHNTYVRHIDRMYMYFIVTPPEATVERGWQRGIERGRYKAVEDYLGHCVEAYSGMPKLLFKWMANDRPRYFFEFLDNDVPRGTYPKLIARGTQGSMQVYALEKLIDIERYKRINILATAPDQVAASSAELSVSKNLGCLRQCIKRIERIEFMDSETDTAYLSIQSGRFKVIDTAMFQRNLSDETFSAVIEAFAPELIAAPVKSGRS